MAMKTSREPNILVVDDQKTFRELNCSALRSGGFTRLRTATDGMEAHALFNAESFDLVISDLEMPRMTGLQLAEAIRNGAHRKAIPIILLTSRADASFVREAGRLRLSAYLLKPASAVQIQQAARKCIASLATGVS